MDRTTGFRLFLLAGCLAALPSIARADETDTQLWLNGALSRSLGAGATATLDGSERLRQGPDQLLLRGALDWKLSPRVTVGGGLAYVTAGGVNEVRPHQHVTLGFGQLAVRSQLEERFVSTEDRALIRLRERAQVTVPLAARTKAVVSGEVYFILRPAKPTDTRDIEQVRLIAALRRSLSPHFEATGGYMMIYAPRPGAPDRLSHVPQLTLSYRM